MAIHKTRTSLAAIFVCLPAAAMPAEARAEMRAEMRAEIRVFACEPEWAALAEEIGGADVSVVSATHGGQDPHHVRARPRLIAQLRSADLLICTGAELEVGWLPLLMQRGAPRAVQPGQPGNLTAADYVDLLGVPEILDRNLDRSLGDVHPGGNPHLHLDPRNVEIIADEVAERLARIDPARADAYRARLRSFRKRWGDAIERWNDRAAALRGMKVVAHHDNWLYLLNWAGLEQIATLERAPGIPPTATHLQEVLERVRETGAKAPKVIIVRAPYEPADASEWLSERTGVPAVELPFTVGGQPGVDDLFSLFDATLTLLEKAGD